MNEAVFAAEFALRIKDTIKTVKYELNDWWILMKMSSFHFEKGKCEITNKDESFLQYECNHTTSFSYNLTHIFFEF